MRDRGAAQIVGTRVDLSIQRATLRRGVDGGDRRHRDRDIDGWGKAEAGLGLAGVNWRGATNAQGRTKLTGATNGGCKVDETTISGR